MRLSEVDTLLKSLALGYGPFSHAFLGIQSNLCLLLKD
jgi:hypothetical protein